MTTDKDVPSTQPSEKTPRKDNVTNGNTSSTSSPVPLSTQYTAEFTATFQGLRERGTALQQKVQAHLSSGAPSLEPLKEDLLYCIKNVGGDICTSYSTVLNTFAWISILIFGASLSYYIGANFLGALINLFIGGFAIGLFVLFGLPLYVRFQLISFNAVKRSDTQVRMWLLALSLGSGLILGAAFSSTYFYSEPFAFITPLTVSLVFAYATPVLGSSKQKQLGTSVGGSFVVQLLIGLITGSLSISFIVLLFFYTAAAFVTLQLLFKNANGNETTHIYMVVYVVIYFYAKSLSFFFLGSSQPYTVEDTSK